MVIGDPQGLDRFSATPQEANSSTHWSLAFSWRGLARYGAMPKGFVPVGRAKVATALLHFPNSYEEHEKTSRYLAHNSITSFFWAAENVELSKAEGSGSKGSALAVAWSMGVCGETATDTYLVPGTKYHYWMCILRHWCLLVMVNLIWTRREGQRVPTMGLLLGRLQHHHLRAK